MRKRRRPRRAIVGATFLHQQHAAQLLCNGILSNSVVIHSNAAAPHVELQKSVSQDTAIFIGDFSIFLTPQKLTQIFAIYRKFISSGDYCA